MVRREHSKEIKQRTNGGGFINSGAANEPVPLQKWVGLIDQVAANGAMSV